MLPLLFGHLNMPIYCNMSNLHRIFCGIQHKLMRNSAGKLPYLGFYTYVKDERYKKTNDITLDILPGKLTLKRFQSPNACREFRILHMPTVVNRQMERLDGACHMLFGLMS